MHPIEEADFPDTFEQRHLQSFIDSAYAKNIAMRGENILMTEGQRAIWDTRNHSMHAAARLINKLKCLSKGAGNATSRPPGFGASVTRPEQPLVIGTYNDKWAVTSD